MAQTWEEQSILDRMVTAVELVRNRLRRATAALEAAGVPYAVVGGNAVAAWVATVDRGAVRNTADVDILLRREDLDAAERAMAAAGFIRYELAGVLMFLDGPTSGPREAVHVIIAREKVRPEYAVAAPDVTDSAQPDDVRAISLQALVQMKLTSYRLRDRVHLLDMLGVGLINQSWTSSLPPQLAARLQVLIDNPDS